MIVGPHPTNLLVANCPSVTMSPREPQQQSPQQVRACTQTAPADRSGTAKCSNSVGKHSPEALAPLMGYISRGATAPAAATPGDAMGCAWFKLFFCFDKSTD